MGHRLWYEKTAMMFACHMLCTVPDITRSAERYPASTVLGIDLSPIQPATFPANCSFELCDCEDPWTWDSTFDYIHGRYITPYISDMSTLLRNIYDNLTPGGIVEFQEAAMLIQAVDDSLNKTRLREWNDRVLEGTCKQNGLEFNC